MIFWASLLHLLFCTFVELRSEAIKTIQSSLLALNTCVDSAGQQNGEIVREGGNSNGKKQSIARLLSDLADLNEKNSDLFSGMKKLRMKDILRLVNLSSNLSLNGGIKDDGGPINSSSSLYQPDIDSQGNWPRSDGGSPSVTVRVFAE